MRVAVSFMSCAVIALINLSEASTPAPTAKKCYECGFKLPNTVQGNANSAEYILNWLTGMNEDMVDACQDSFHPPKGFNECDIGSNHHGCIKTVIDDFVVWRGCATKNECDASNDKIKTTCCKDKDHCNSAGSVVAGVLLLFTTVSVHLL